VFVTVMGNQLEEIFARLHETADFADTDFSDVNATSSDGENALHCAVRWGDLAAAKALIEAGIDVNKAGDLGYAPLHVPCMQGNAEIVKLLTDSGADVFALSEGDAPFTTARLGGHDDICELLASLMEETQKRDPNVWVRARIAQLRREIASLEKETLTDCAEEWGDFTLPVTAGNGDYHSMK
jgi:ankyrin repeat protein